MDIVLQDFNAFPFGEKKQDFSPLKEYVDMYQHLVKKVTNSFIAIGFLLDDLRESRAYENYPMSKEYRLTKSFSTYHWTFETFVEDYFGITKKTAYNYINVANRYGDKSKKVIDAYYKDWGYTKLLLLEKMENEFGRDSVNLVKPTMSVREIKSVIKKLEDDKKDPTKRMSVTEIDNVKQHAVVFDFYVSTVLEELATVIDLHKDALSYDLAKLIYNQVFVKYIKGV